MAYDHASDRERNSDEESRTPRALLTDRERRLIADEDPDATDNQRYQAASRVRKKISEHMVDDVAILRDNHPELLSELRREVGRTTEEHPLAGVVDYLGPEAWHDDTRVQLIEGMTVFTDEQREDIFEYLRDNPNPDSMEQVADALDWDRELNLQAEHGDALGAAMAEFYYTLLFMPQALGLENIDEVRELTRTLDQTQLDDQQPNPTPTEEFDQDEAERIRDRLDALQQQEEELADERDRQAMQRE